MEQTQITQLLQQVRGGDREAFDRLFPLVYVELRRLAGAYMRHERPDHTLQATAVVHEAYVKLVGSGGVEWQDRAHFFAVAAQQMRRILVDHARAVRAAKRGGPAVKLSLDEVNRVAEKRDEDVVAIDDALTELEKRDARAARVVELRFFGGLTDKETAEVLGVAVATTRRDWEFARAWLFRHLSRGE